MSSGTSGAPLGTGTMSLRDHSQGKMIKDYDFIIWARADLAIAGGIGVPSSERIVIPALAIECKSYQKRNADDFVPNPIQADLVIEHHELAQRHVLRVWWGPASAITKGKAFDFQIGQSTVELSTVRCSGGRQSWVDTMTGLALLGPKPRQRKKWRLPWRMSTSR